MREIGTMTVRKVAPSDRSPLTRLLQSIENFTLEEVDVAIELLDIYLSQPDQKDYLFLCSTDESDTPVGYVCFGPTPLAEGVYDLYWIAVHPDWQNKGVGSRLMEVVEKEMLKIKARMLMVETSGQESYRRTVQFYLKRGYNVVATIEDFYKPGDAKIIFSKRFQEAGEAH
ncbi:MAG: GNAT family N-acetyltransferase [Candidatus Tectomicrobia bacterium]|nr:GNAT family N-acetyltransferase [Candidatus Tectomicrobia bacterium]